MKCLLQIRLAFLLCAFPFALIGAQPSLKPLPRERAAWEFGLMFGYNSPVGMGGPTIGYRPPVLRRVLQLDAGFGAGIPEGAKLSLGLNLQPFKEHMFVPYVGASYTWGMGGWYPLEDGTGSVQVGLNRYVSPYLALKFNSPFDFGQLKLLVGDAKLIGKPQVTYSGNTGGPVDVAYYNRTLGSGIFVAVSLGGDLKALARDHGRGKTVKGPRPYNTSARAKRQEIKQVMKEIMDAE